MEDPTTNDRPAKPRSPLRLIIMLVLVVLGLAAGWVIMTTPGMKPVVISVYEPPIIKPDERIHDLGTVETDSKADHTFLLYNLGGQHLRIQDVEVSCGCTVADISKKVIAPGGFSRLKVEMDTSIKLGKTKKKITVISNDPKTPALKLFLTATVVRKTEKVHDMQMVNLKAEDPLVLFKGECATCHVDKGKGKSGKALFVADCAMCHGMNGQGVPDIAPSLLMADYTVKAQYDRMRRIIAEGSPNSPQMPPFSKAKGGPLSDDEIDSLMNFLKFQRTQAQLGLLDQPDPESEEDERDFQEALKEAGMKP